MYSLAVTKFHKEVVEMKLWRHKTMALLLVVLFLFFVGAGMVFAGSGKAVEIKLWHFGGLDSELKYIPEVVANFEKANPGITVKRTHFPWDARLEKIVVAYRQKSLPDVIMTDSFEVPNMVEMGILTAYMRSSQSTMKSGNLSL